jgi:hypothetical protein
MNKLLLLLAFCSFSVLAIAQAPPQEVCYQAVATDADGRELPGAQIGILVTILQGSEIGPAVWVESHAPMTDEFGLFDFNIGSGTRMDGTVQLFRDIPWGLDRYYLKVEMDASGGSNYELMGINQIVSVPYALHAGSASISSYADTANVAMTALNDLDTDPLNEIQSLQYDSATGTLSLDGSNAVTLTVDDADSNPTNEIQEMVFDGENLSLVAPDGSVSSTISFGEHSFARSGASFDFPQGIFGEHKVLPMGIYEVPFGKVFYVTGSTREILVSNPLVQGGSIMEHPPTPNMPVFPAGTVLTNCQCTGFEVNVEATVEPVIVDLTDSANEYEVPAGKVLFIKSGLANDANGILNIDGMDIEFFRPNLSRWTRMVTVPGGSKVKKPVNQLIVGDFVLTGYLIEM